MFEKHLGKVWKMFGISSENVRKVFRFEKSLENVRKMFEKIPKAKLL